MEIHKPHPAKTWREFFVEIGTIVTGILIALALEQAIESFHEQKIAAEARDAVRAEVQEDLWWLDLRTKDGACTVDRMHQIGQVLDNANHGRPYSPPQSIGIQPHAKLTRQRWEGNAQAGRTSLFTPVEQRDYDNIYFAFDEVRQAQAQEDDLWSELQAIDGQDHLTPEALYGFSILLAQARFEDSIIQLATHRAFQTAAIMHLKPANTDVIDFGPSENPKCLSITAKHGQTSTLSELYGKSS